MRNKLFATAKGGISLSWFIAVLLLFVAVASEFAYGGTWTTKTSMPAARSMPAAGVINGVLYVAGGSDGVTGGTTTLQAYNPTTNTWNTLASMPGRRYNGNGAGVIDGKLYVAGGWNAPDSGIPQNQLFVYDPASNSWSTKASMPTLSADGASGVINGKLYVTTAANGYSGWRNFLHVYDPATNTWSSLASSPSVHDGPAFGVINGKFYVAGGGDASGASSSNLDVYDPSTNTWATKASMPTAGWWLVSGVFNGKLYAIGGASYNTVYVYDPSADTWTTETSMPTARYGAAGGVINGVLYVAGGSNGTSTLATVEAFTFSSLPTATTGSVTNVTSSSATLNGTVNANGTSTTAWFNYGITSGSYSGTSTTQSVSGTSTTSVSSDISGLSASTTYYYRIAAQSSAGTSYGSETSFITSTPADTTAPTGSVSINSGASYTNSTTVTLSLSATDSVGVTGYYLSDSSTIPSASASGWTSVTSTTSYSATVSYSLSSGEGSKTIYAWYKDAAGNVSSTASATITLDTTVPTVTISSPTSSATYTATSSTISMGGSASDSSSGISSIAWSNNRGGNGTATGTASWTVSSISLSSGDNVITVTARDGAGNSGTATITVTYNAGSAPTVVTGDTTNVTTNTATLTGTVNANGLSTTAWFEYGTAKGTYGNKTTTQTVTASSNISISAAISGLSSNTTYYYRVAASNSAGASYGSENSFTTITSSTPVPTPTQTLNDGLVAYYPFNGNANDESGNGNNGTVNGATLTTDRFGNTNGAYRFDGNSDYIEVSDFSFANKNERSIALWVKPDVGTAVQDFISKHSGEQDVEILVRMESDGKYDVEWTIGGNFYDLSTGLAGANDSIGLVEPSYDIFDFFVAIYDGKELKLYINGNLIKSRSASGNIVDNSYPLTIGAYAYNHSEEFKGVLDDIRIYNRALSESEIQDLYKEDTTPTTPSPTLTPTPTPTPTTSPAPTLPPLPTPAPTLPPLPTPQVSPSPIQEGVVFGFANDQDEQPLKGVTITITGKNSSDSTETDEDGYYEFRGLSQGAYALTYEKEGYLDQTQDVSLNEGELKDLGTVTMEQVVKGKISGYVANIKGDPIESVRLKLKGIKTKVIKTASSDADGFFEFTDLEADTYVIVAKKKKYRNTRQKVVLEEGESTEIEIVMRKTSKRIKELLLEEDVQ